MLALAPQASSTMREEVDPDRSRPKIVLHIKNAGAISKPPKKKAKQPSDIVITCNYCGEAVSSIDIKAKNVQKTRQVVATQHRHFYIYCKL